MKNAKTKTPGRPQLEHGKNIRAAAADCESGQEVVEVVRRLGKVSMIMQCAIKICGAVSIDEIQSGSEKNRDSTANLVFIHVHDCAEAQPPKTSRFSCQAASTCVKNSQVSVSGSSISYKW